MARRWKTPPLGINPPAEFVLVRGNRPYVNVRATDDHGGSLYHMSDRRQLRSFAEAILDALEKSDAKRARATRLPRR